MSDYIGKTISLVSNKGLRYVGLLDSINANDATVALKSVRLLGTEGRMLATPHLEVPPSNDVYDYVMFRGSDVKDLLVLDIPVDQVEPNYPHAYYPPQPYQSQDHHKAASHQAPPASIEHSSRLAAPLQQYPLPSQAAFTASTPQNPTPTQPQGQPAPLPVPSAASKLSPSHGSGSPPQPQPGPQPTPSTTTRLDPSPVPSGLPQEFDFAAANAKFEREKSRLELQEGPRYNKKSSFFDTILSSSDERHATSWLEERTRNMDTFGEELTQHRTSSRGGRGRGRGGRGSRGRGGRGSSSFSGSWNNRGYLGRGRSEPKPEWA